MALAVGPCAASRDPLRDAFCDALGFEKHADRRFDPAEHPRLP
jgi:hypothetical protein